MSATPSQGTCARATRSCELESLAPGASATIRLVIRGQVVGARVNVVEVAAAETDADLNGQRRVGARARRGGDAVRQAAREPADDDARSAGHALGHGANDASGSGLGSEPAPARSRRVARGDDERDGVAAFTVTPTRPGLMVVDVAGNSRCQWGIGVLGEVTPGVSG